jgi:hypothetical protein
MSDLPLLRLCYHRDYDGVVAAAMVQATTPTVLDLVPVQYTPNLNWTERSLPPNTGIVDFLYHPDATLWLDHHATTFPSEAAHLSFRPDPFHVFTPDAASCPGVIVGLPWFEGGEHWDDYVHWADIIDGAAYTSPAQANDLANPHILLSHVIADLIDPDSLAIVIRAIPGKSAAEVLELPDLQSSRARLLRDDVLIRQLLATLLRVKGGVTVLDQSDLALPYQRYLAYERHPATRYGIGLYRSGDAIIVSVGENPWNERGPVHLGELCREFGGGGRRATAGVPMLSVEAARELAMRLADRLNEALLFENPKA